MSTGKQIRKYRKLRKFTQKSLGEAVGMTESAIRNYELDLRTPNPELMDKIAKTLDIPVEDMQDYEIASSREALEALFRLKDAFGLEPTEDGHMRVNPKAEGSQKLIQALKAWRGVLDEVESGEMSKEDYELWKASIRS